MNKPIAPIDPKSDAAARERAVDAETERRLDMLSVVAQIVLALFAGSWAASASAPGAPDAGIYGAVGLLLALFAAHAAVKVVAWVPVLIGLPRVVRMLTQTPAPGPWLASRHDRHWQSGFIALHVVLLGLGALLVAAAVWWVAAPVALLPTALRFVAAAAALSLLTPRALDGLS